jgi:transcriptional regulator with XRE-family HTH domain
VALGQAVRALRVEREMTQEELALQALMDVTYVSVIERGMRNLTWTALMKVSRALDVAPSELVRKAEEIEKR